MPRGSAPAAHARHVRPDEHLVFIRILIAAARCYQKDNVLQEEVAARRLSRALCRWRFRLDRQRRNHGGTGFRCRHARALGVGSGRRSRGGRCRSAWARTPQRRPDVGSALTRMSHRHPAATADPHGLAGRTPGSSARRFVSAMPSPPFRPAVPETGASAVPALAVVRNSG